MPLWARGRWLVLAALTAWAVTRLVQSGPGPAIDVSTERLQSTPGPPIDHVLVLGWHGDTPITAAQLAAIDARATDLRALPAVSDVKLPTQLAPDIGRIDAASLSQHPLIRDRWVSADGTALLGRIESHAGTDLTQLADAVLALSRIDGLSTSITAPQLLDQAQAQVIETGLSRLLVGGSAGFILLMLLLWRSLRAAAGIVLSMVVSLLWTLAAQRALGIPLDMVTLIAPALTATLTLAYAMHLIASSASTDTLTEAVRAVRQPMLLTAATTIAGLLALALSPAPAIRDFALLASLGAGFSALSVLTVLPLVLRTRARKPHWRRGWPQMLQPVLGLAARLTAHGSKRLLFVWALLLIGLAVGAVRVTHELDPMRGLPTQDPARQNFERLNHAVGGLQTLDIEIALDRSQAWIEPGAHAALKQLEQTLEANARVGTVFTHLDHARAASQWFGQKDADLPAGPALTQLLVFGTSDSVYDRIDRRFRVARLQLSTPVTGSGEAAQLLDDIDQTLAGLRRSLPSATTTVRGSLQRLQASAEALAKSQRRSLLLALAAMWVLLGILFASARTGLLLLLPNTLPLLAFFGFIGWSGLQLGPVTGLAACVVLGIAVDDTLHYFARYHALARRRAAERPAAIEALEQTLLPITMTTLALIVGFICLMATALEAHLQFGLLCALALMVAWCCDVFLTPLLAARMRFVTLWDTLRLDLGTDPQHQIPLLAGLSKRQARTFALLTDLQTRPAGAVIMRAGDHSDECFVVIDGELRVDRDRADRDWHVATLGRGALVGEVGLFQQARTANVVAQSPVRLIRFSSADLRQLVRQAPRIAAVVMFNLNAIQAERRSQDSRAYLGDAPTN